MIPKRRYPTPKEKAEIIARQNGVCAIKDCTDTGPFIFDHELPLWVHGDNSTENFQALCIPCNKIKTAKDAKDRAKIKRILLKADKEAREKRRAKKKRIQSPGFDRRWRRKLNGETVKRISAPRMA